MRRLSHYLLRNIWILLVQWSLWSWLLLTLLLIGKFLTKSLSVWLRTWIIRWRNICSAWWLNFSIKAFIKVRALHLWHSFNFLCIELNLVGGLLWASSTISINLLLKDGCCILNDSTMRLWRFALWCRLSRLWMMLWEAIGSQIIISTHKVLLHYGTSVRLLLCCLLCIARLKWLTLLLNCFQLCRHLCLHNSNFHCQLFNPTVLNMNSYLHLSLNFIF